MDVSVFIAIEPLPTATPTATPSPTPIVPVPIDLIPEFLPVIGPLDDVLVVALALRYAARRVPRSVLLEAWPGDVRLLGLLLGIPRQEITGGPAIR